MKILKYPLELTATVQTRWMPPGDIVHVHAQQGLPTVWAEVDDATEDRLQVQFAVIYTGDRAPAGFGHIGTVHIDGFVYHVYRRML